MKKSNKVVDDPYLDNDMCVNRLVDNWKEHKRIIIAFDFDNTVYDYYKQGYTYTKVIDLLKECKNMGCVLILNTCCDESKFDFMREECSKVGLFVDYINESPEYIPFTGNKIYYNIMLDDRAGLNSAYKILYKTKEIIKNETF